MPDSYPVDPFLGVDAGGHVLCGPYLPFSLVRLGPDTLPPQPPSGYASGQPITGFSHTHVSGTGGAGRYGNIAVFPFTGAPRLFADASEHADEFAEVGLYRTRLVPSDIKVELTSTPRTGLHRYTFPSGAKANLRVDAGAVVQTGHNLPATTSGGSTGGFVEWISETELVGRGDYRGGWGHQFPYSVYFYARFRRAPERRLVGTAKGLQAHYPTPAGKPAPVMAEGVRAMAVAHFEAGGVVELEVGVSYVSLAKARASVERELAGAPSLEEVAARAKETWRPWFERVKVEGGDATRRGLFYTSLYRLFCMPSDLGVDDEFGSWHSGVRHFTDFYCFWDSVRNANSLLGLVAPEMEAAFLNNLVDIAEHVGWLPDAWIAGHGAMIQGGSSVDILFCEAALKKLPGVDHARALRWMRKNAEVESPDPLLYGRHLRHYRAHGFVPAHEGALYAASRTLEYAYQDWCIGRLARELGDEALADDRFAAARRVWESWSEEHRVFVPRLADGSPAQPFHPDRSGNPREPWFCPYFYEATARQWMWNVQHDFAGLVRRLGGDAGFVAALDAFLAPPPDGRGHHGAHYHSKETMLHAPFLYHYAGRPDLSARAARRALERFFKPGREGLSDNEDMGCQSAFYICVSLGLYPLMGQDLYWLTPPLFPRAELRLGPPGAPALVVEAEGAPERRDIARLTLNGRPLDRYWLRHGEIAAGGVLRFELVAEGDPRAWPEGERPPSPA